MKSEELLSMLYTSRIGVFTLKDIERLTGKNIKYSSLYVKRLIERRKIIKIERGKYCLPVTNVYEIASNIVFPSYISLFAAFVLYGLTTQQILTIEVITTKRHKPVEFEGHKIRFTTLDKSRFFGFSRLSNAAINAALPEKAIADSLYLSRPNENYVYEAFRNGMVNGVVNKKKLEEFAASMHSKKVSSGIKHLFLYAAEEENVLSQ